MKTKTWSQEQEAIFANFAANKGNLVVRARAGTGKTTTMIEAITKAPSRAKKLLCAFNKKNAVELSERLGDAGARNAEAKTLHSLGFSAVRCAAPGTRVDNDRGFWLSREALEIGAPKQAIRLVANLASKAKNCALPADLSHSVIEDMAWRFDLIPDERLKNKGYGKDKIINATMRALRFAGEEDGTVDFDDMIWLPVRLNIIRPRYDLVVVDEAQDMNPVQLELAMRSCRPEGRIVIVGDDRQAIYGFRGADSGSIDRTLERLGAVELPLTVTYRCPTAVVELAQDYVPDYQAAPNASPGVVRWASTENMISDAREGDFVLSRTNAAIVGACLDLLRAGRRARVQGRDIGKMILALVDHVADGAPTVAVFLRRLADWKESEIAKIKAAGRKNEDELIESICDRSEVIQVLSENLATVRELRARIEDLFADHPGRREIMCSTVHRAKGLESDRVFVLEDTLRDGKIEEENIRYVAYTRARQELVLVSRHAAEECAETAESAA